MKNLLDSIWAPEDDDTIIITPSVEPPPISITASCGKPTDYTMNGTVCQA